MTKKNNSKAIILLTILMTVCMVCVMAAMLSTVDAHAALVSVPKISAAIDSAKLAASKAAPSVADRVLKSINFTYKFKIK